MVKVLLVTAVAASAFALAALAAAGGSPAPVIAFATADEGTDATYIAVVGADGTGLRRLTRDDTGGYEPRFTRDGRRLIFWTERRSRDAWIPWRVGRDGRGRVRLPGASPGGSLAAVSPSGTLVARGTPQGLELRDVRDRLVRRFVITAGGSYYGSAVWSPDGRWIAVTARWVWLVRTDGSQKPRRLSTTTHGYDEYAEAFSPDSRWLLSSTEYEDYVTSPRTGVRRRLRGSLAGSAATWLDDSKRIAFAGPWGRIETTDIDSGRTALFGRAGVTALAIAASPKRDEIAVSGDKALYLLSAGSHRARLLAHRALDRSPDGAEIAWSPDGAEIAFVSHGAVFAVSRSAGRVRTIVAPAPALPYASGPVWAPDRSRIAFTRRRRYGRPEAVYTMRADGSDLRLVGAGAAPAWAPDSRRLAYVAPDGRVTVADGNSPPRAVAVGESPTWSPDGHTIAYLSYRHGILTSGDGDDYDAEVGSTLYLVDANGGEPRVLVPDRDPGAPLFDPRWSPAGTTIAARQDEIVEDPETGFGYHSWQLVLVDVRDGTLRRLDDDRFGDFAWSPDGSLLLHALGGGLRLLTTGDGSARTLIGERDQPVVRSVSWSPAGAQFAYTRCGDGTIFGPRDCDVWAANADGSGRHRLAHTFSRDGTLAWGP